MANRIDQQQPAQVEWNPEAKVKIKKAIDLATNIVAGPLIKGALKAGCKKNLGPAADISIEGAACITTVVVQKGLHRAVDKSFETPESSGSRCFEKLKKK